MFITTLKFNTKDNPELKENLENCDWIHRFILEKGFYNIWMKHVRHNLNLLYYKDENVIYFQSTERPKFNNNDKVFESVPEISELTNDFNVRDTVKILCTYNPTRKANGKRRYINNKEEREEWFKKHVAEYGVIVTNYNEIKESVIIGKKKTGNNLITRAVTFKCIFEITDKDKFWKLINTGIGKGRSYGCGMFVINKEENYVYKK